MFKWNKKIAIQYIQEMRSPIEEIAKQGQGGDGSIIGHLRESVLKVLEQGRRTKEL